MVRCNAPPRRRLRKSRVRFACHSRPRREDERAPGGFFALTERGEQANGGRDDQKGTVRRRIGTQLQDRGTASHLRLVARHGVRVVRLLSVRGAGAVLRGAVLPAREPDRGTALGVRRVRRRLPRATVRRARLRPHRRPRRPQVHLPCDDRLHGRHRRSSSACCRLTQAIGWARADPAGDAAPRAGPRARRRVRRRGDLRRGACAARTSAATTRPGSRPRRRWGSSSRCS